MPLIKVERDVLQVICEEHRQTHRGAREHIIFVAMGAISSKDKSRIILAMERLQRYGFIVARPDAWAPTREGLAELALDPADLDPIHHGEAEAKKAPDTASKNSSLPIKRFTKEEICKAFDVPVHLVDQVQDRSFSEIEINEAKEGLGKESANEIMRFLVGTDRISDDLLNRCAAMNATLLAQAEKANASGDPGAWRDLHWLMETGRQLVALRGDS